MRSATPRTSTRRYVIAPVDGSLSGMQCLSSAQVNQTKEKFGVQIDRAESKMC